MNGFDYDVVQRDFTGAFPTVSATCLDDTSHFPLRSIRRGPESSLVGDFIHTLSVPRRKNCRGTVIREPNLLSGFPDLVVLHWHYPTAQQWKMERKSLRKDDIRIAQLLHSSGPLDDASLCRLAGAKHTSCLKRLVAAGVVHRRSEKWSIRSLRKIFALRSIISFEAKMEASSKVLDQAVSNRWFASRSYVLLPDAPKNAFRSKAKDLGIGIWISGQKSPLEKAPEANLQPASYASWFFNEYVCNSLISSEGPTS